MSYTGFALLHFHVTDSLTHRTYKIIVLYLFWFSVTTLEPSFPPYLTYDFMYGSKDTNTITINSISFSLPQNYVTFSFSFCRANVSLRFQHLIKHSIAISILWLHLFLLENFSSSFNLTFSTNSFLITCKHNQGAPLDLILYP